MSFIVYKVCFLNNFRSHGLALSYDSSQKARMNHYGRGWIWQTRKIGEDMGAGNSSHSGVETGAERHILQAEKKTRAANFYLFQQLNPPKLLNSQILGKWRRPHDSLAVTSSISAEKSSSSHDSADLLQLFPHYLMSLIVT